MTGFDKRVAVVTGAGSGIGQALATGLAGRGARLALADVNQEGLDQTVSMIETLGSEARGWNVDVSDHGAVERFAADVVDHFGSANQIYNNAGIAFARTVEESDYADYERVFGVNLWGVIYGTKAFLPHLIASGEGHVTNISSLNGYMAQPEMSHYCTSKFAVRGFTETLRIEMIDADHPVGVTSVHPGGVATNIATSALDVAKGLGMEITADDTNRRDAYNKKLLRMKPEKAAKIILDGVAKNKARVRVGRDAVAVDLLVRSIPAKYHRISLAFAHRALR